MAEAIVQKRDQEAEAIADTRRLTSKPQNLNDAYGPPSNFLEIDVSNPQTIGVGRGKYTTYDVRLKVVVPPLPGKALFRQLPFLAGEGIFDETFIEERRQGLEQFINKVAGHPLAQNERCLHMFLQDETIDKSYTPCKVKHA
ncbi:sorting nexin-3 isoform X2 [Latimeria chalumnae]|uniref:sorting nexin-3 isoform X2 n=1 Tax=Latimeria chalumnae TaxID=7897 RepID=UPI00313A7B8C